MAKKKTQATKGGDPAALSSSKTDDELRKMFGDDCLYTGSRILEHPPEIISLSPRLDEALHGGIQVGTMVTLSGASGCGKTTTALHIAVKWQQRGRQVYYAAAEERLWAMNLEGVQGLDPSKVKVIGSREGYILNAQDYLMAFEKILKNETDTLLIIDSISILSDEGEMNATQPGQGALGGANRLIGSFLRRMAAVLPINRNVVVAIAQVYSNIGGKKKYKVNMPTKMEFGRGTGLECDYAEPIASGKEFVGQNIQWKVVRSPLGPPGAKFESILRYKFGIDEVAELVSMGLEFSKIHLNGSWITMTYLGEDCPKLQGAEKVRDYLIANPEHKELLYEALRYYMTA